ncbi:flippase (plasmid) [Halobaculum sp. CBA1158]|uniref:flippase n=1 Tax=Halobaculum sp. CBA1158 TaxID=2904243 RepID=UPI001F22E662|nr:flippase [Halobaculum sp. CBA1158]UIP01463.1 flippase [Halobaculum sp. CBA1158]
MDLTARIVRGVKVTLLATTVSQLARGAMLLLLTRVLLDPGGYGLLYFALSVLMLVEVFSSIPKSGARYVTAYLETDEGLVPHVIRLTVGYLLVATVAFGAALALFDDPIAALLGAPALPPLLTAGAGYVVFSALYTFCHVTFQALDRLELSAVVSVTESVLRLAFVVAFVLLGLDVLGALLGYVASYAVAATVGGWLLYVRYYRDAPESSSPDPGLGRRILSYSAPITGINAATVIDARSTTLLVGVFVNPTAVGFYTLARQLVQFSVVPASALGFVISPQLGGRRADGDDAVAAAIYERSLTYVLALFVPAGVGLALVARPLVVHVFGSGYAGAIPLLQVFGPFVLVRAVTSITNNSLDYLGEAHDRARSEVTLAAANVGLNLVLIPTLGVLGAAIATVVSKSTYTALNVYFLHRALRFDVRSVARTGVVVVGISAAMAAVVVLLRPLIAGVASLASVVACAVAVWFVLAVASGVLDVSRLRAAL